MRLRVLVLGLLCLLPFSGLAAAHLYIYVSNGAATNITCRVLQWYPDQNCTGTPQYYGSFIGCPAGQRVMISQYDGDPGNASVGVENTESVRLGGPACQSTSAGGAYDLTFTFLGGAVVTNYCTYAIRNNNSFRVAYQLIGANGAAIAGSYGSTFVDAGPGEVARLYAQTTNACSSITVRMFWGAPPDLVTGSGGQYYSTNGFGYGGSGTLPPGAYDTATVAGGPYNGTNAAPFYTPPSLVNYSNPASWGSNQPISFTTNAVAGDQLNTLQTGFGALYSAIVAGNANNDARLSEIASRLGTNGSGSDDIVRALGTNISELGAITNELGLIQRTLTNAPPGWGDRGTLLEAINAAGMPTNKDAAIALARGVLGDVATESDSVATAAGAGAPSGVGSGDASPLTFAFCGTTICLDPAEILPGIPALIKSVFSWLALLTCVLWMGEQYVQQARASAQAETGGVPNLNIDVPILGNALGVGVAIIVPVVYTLGWAAIFHFLFKLSGVDVESSLTSLHALNPFTAIGSVSGTALYLINEFFDVDLMLSLVWVRLSWYWVGGQLVFIFGMAARWLWGK